MLEGSIHEKPVLHFNIFFLPALNFEREISKSPASASSWAWEKRKGKGIRTDLTNDQSPSFTCVDTANHAGGLVWEFLALSSGVCYNSLWQEGRAFLRAPLG